MRKRLRGKREGGKKTEEARKRRTETKRKKRKEEGKRGRRRKTKKKDNYGENDLLLVSAPVSQKDGCHCCDWPNAR